MDFQTADSAVRLYSELLLVIADVRNRKRHGRDKKDDASRVHFIKHVALPELRGGRLPAQRDLSMLWLSPRHGLNGAELAALDTWVKRHAQASRAAHDG